MSRPKKVAGANRDGYINYRVPPDMSNDLNALAFLMSCGVGEVVRLAIADLLSKHRKGIDAVESARKECMPSSTPSDQEKTE